MDKGEYLALIQLAKSQEKSGATTSKWIGASKAAPPPPIGNMTFKELQQFDLKKKWKKEKRAKERKAAHQDKRIKRFSPAESYKAHQLSETSTSNLSNLDSVMKCSPSFTIAEKHVSRKKIVDAVPHYDLTAGIETQKCVLCLHEVIFSGSTSILSSTRLQHGCKITGLFVCS